MTNDLGALLKEWRQARPLGMEAAARQAELTRMTLHRWETGQCWPRLPELEAYLRALGVSASQRQQALALIEAPRALVRVRQETARQNQTHEVPGKLSATVAGGLLYALRQCRDLTLDEAARLLGVHKSTLSRWERGEAWPTSERLHQVCFLLGASPQELMALTREPFAEGDEDADSIEALSGELVRVCMLAPHDPEEALKDLLFLQLEARVWPHSSRPEYALLLSNVRAAYASYLSGSKRYGEASRWADGALENTRAVRGTVKNDVWWLYAMQARARCDIFGTKRGSLKLAMDTLRDCLSQMTQPDFAAWVMQVMAECALHGGDKQAAVRWSTAACQKVRESEQESEIAARQCNYVALLLSAGLPQQALEAIPQHGIKGETADEMPLYPNQRTQMALHGAKALYALHDKQEAHEWLTRGYRLLDTGYLSPRVQTHLRDQADSLAQLF